MQSRSYLFLFLVIGLVAISGFLYTKTTPAYGLDVTGGVRLLLEIDDKQLTKDQRADMEGVRSKLVTILTNRVSKGLGVAEGNVIPKGDNQFIVELPGQTDVQKAVDTLGSSASIMFYWAKNVQTEQSRFRPYTDDTSDKESASPSVSFHDRSGKLIARGDPEYAKMIEGWELILKGDQLQSAKPEVDASGSRPMMLFSPSGARAMERWSRRVESKGEKIAAVLDGNVISINPLADNTILSSNAVIHGTFPPGYVTTLVDLLNAGALPVSLNILSREKEDPTIGFGALHAILVAGAIAFGVISLFLIAYYSFPGFVALLALLIYVLFTLTVLKLIGATFSLAAIAGFILSVGMAVDANILVFERFKEEVKLGKKFHTAIELGFRRALPAIVDSNSCTILTSLVLVNLGTGPVKGFATTLMIGVAISLFTAVMVTRSLLMFFVDSGFAANPSWYALDRSWFGKRFDATAEAEPLKVVEKSKKWFIISIATIVVGLVFAPPPLNGFKLNVEFLGGFESSYKLSDKSATAPSLAAKLDAAGLKGGNIKLADAGGNRIAYVTVPNLPQLAGSDTAAIKTIGEAIGASAADNTGYTKIGPTVQKETLYNAILGVVLSSGLIILFLALRFGLALGGFAAGFRFGVSAIAALLHDVFVMIGMAALFGFIFKWEISALFITAMLTVIGFSVHDTIVIFDRIRENLRRPIHGEEFGHLVDRSITQSFARSINTSMTVMVTLAILVFFGTATPDLKFFCVAMLIGILSGTYSSIYNASPILYLWDLAILKKRGHEHTLVGMAANEHMRARTITSTAVPVAPMTPQSEAPVSPTTGRSYGQVKRRASAVKRSQSEIDDEP